jgi:hypothetical protein
LAIGTFSFNTSEKNSMAAAVNHLFWLNFQVGNPVQRGHRFQRKADSNPVIADSG